MKKSTTLLMKTGILVLAAVVLAAMIKFPQTEGRAANLDLISIYSDPLIVYVYFASIPFFVGLYQTFRVLQLLEKPQTFKTYSQEVIKSLQIIKVCALSLIAGVAGAVIFIRFIVQGEDAAGPIMLAIWMIVGLALTAKVVDLMQRRFQKSTR